MADFLTEYNKKFPDVKLEVLSGSTTTLMDLLRSNDVDLIVVMGSRIVDYDFFRVMIREAGISFVASAGHPLADEEKVKFSSLADYKLILPEKDSLYRKTIESIAGQQDCILTPILQVNSTAVITELLKKGMGISYLPDYMIRKDLEEGALVKLNVEYEKSKYYIQILHHRNKWVTSQMEEFFTLADQMLV